MRRAFIYQSETSTPRPTRPQTANAVIAVITPTEPRRLPNRLMIGRAKESATRCAKWELRRTTALPCVLWRIERNYGCRCRRRDPNRRFNETAKNADCFSAVDNHGALRLTGFSPSAARSRSSGYRMSFLKTGFHPSGKKPDAAPFPIYALRLGEHALERRQQAPQCADHFGGHLGIDARASQLRAQEIGGGAGGGGGDGRGG